MSKIILVTGATGKVGTVFIQRLLADPKFDSFTVRALCHNREPEPHARIENLHGSIEHREVVEKAMDGVTHVLHLATVKETPDQIMDVAVKGLFWILETCRTSPTFKQLIMVGGLGMGPFRNFYSNITQNTSGTPSANPSSSQNTPTPAPASSLGCSAASYHAVQGYPLTKQGQKTWLHDFLQCTQNHTFIAGTFYFSPEFHRLIWSSFSLFTFFGNATPAVDVFMEFS